MKTKQIGIYLISSPSGKKYVGQSRDIYERWKKYDNLQCKAQPRLYNSFLKYGVDKHEFTVLELCEFDELNIRERHYQEQYDVLGKKGLNCLYQKTEDKPRVVSAETRAKMSVAQKNNGEQIRKRLMGHYVSPETRAKISASNKGKIHSKESIARIVKAMTGSKCSEETKAKMSAALMGNKNSLGHNHSKESIAKMKGRIVSNETKERMSAALKGRVVSDETKAKISASLMGNKISLKTRAKLSARGKKKVLHVPTGIIYNSLIDCAKALGRCKGTVSSQLRGKTKNKLNIKYV
tara:strand:- start:37 stop:918 length:882 start_codon:yes stop_codon:yes gene_type:complete